MDKTRCRENDINEYYTNEQYRRQGRSRIKAGVNVDELPEIVSIALRGTDAVGSCTIRRDEYDVDEDGGVDVCGKDDCD